MNRLIDSQQRFPLEQIESPILYVHNALLFPHGSMQIRHPRKEPAKNELVLIYHWKNPHELLFYSGCRFTVGVVLETYEKESQSWCDVKGLYTARLIKRSSLYRGIHRKESLPVSVNEEYQVDRLRKMAQQFVFLIDIPESDKLIYLMTFISKLSELTDFISHYFITVQTVRRSLYNERDIEKKADLLMRKLDEMIKEVHRKKGSA